MSSALSDAALVTSDAELAARFEVRAIAGRGGMGCVFRALDRATGTEVALKVLATSGPESHRFTREADVLRQLEHPGIVGYRDHGVTPEGRHFLVMEWLEGVDLARWLTRMPLAIEDALRLVHRMAGALAAAHHRGILHRDVKPANVFLVDGRLDAAKLIDFGLARAEADDGLTRPGTVMGTPAYMAPEQVRGERVTARADVYSLGALLFRLLTGYAPFRGEHQIAILAKVLVDEPPDLRDLRPEAPPALAALVARMLSKDPEQRPADGAEVIEALAAITLAVPEVDYLPAAVTTRERRVACVVLCAVEGGGDATLQELPREAEPDGVREAIEACGGQLEVLAPGVWLITVAETASTTEQADRAARCALATAALRPHTPIVIATGRVEAPGALQVGEVIDRAAAALLVAESEPTRAVIRLDEVTAGLLDDRFEISGAGPWRQLFGERAALSHARTLLGRRTTCLGRAPELATLTAALAACTDEPRAGAVLITAPPGLGKSRLVNEFLRAAGADVDLLFAAGDAVRPGTPFGMAADVLRRCGRLQGGTPTDGPRLRELVSRHVQGPAADRLTEFLGELCGLHATREAATPMLLAARADPVAMSDAIQEAWVDWLRARCSDKSVVLVLDDVHWADLPSMRLVDAALDALADRPLLVVAMGRPEVHTRFPELWQKRALQELRLPPLGRGAAERLVRDALGTSVDGDVVTAVVERATGNPFHLEELVRAVVAGNGPAALPDSILGMIQSRLLQLSLLQRRVLRAASVFGETCWAGGITTLLGEGATVDEVQAGLRELVAEEILLRRTTPRVAGEAEYAFRHALVRDAAYAMLTDRDRVSAHRLAGAWLESRQVHEPAMLAAHHQAGEAPELALGLLRRAAEQALEANDLDRAASYVGRALACGPDDSTAGALWAIEAEVAYWRGALDLAGERASSAAGRLTEGTTSWLSAMSAKIGAAGQQGHNDRVAEALRRVAVAASPPEARGSMVVTLCRGLTQLYWAHHAADLEPVTGRLEVLVALPEPLAAHENGWVHRVRAESAWLHARHSDRCLDAYALSCQAFAEARALRNLSVARLNWACLASWSGDVAGALALVDLVRDDAARLGSGFLRLYGQTVRGLVQAYAADPNAEATMGSALPQLGGSPRLSLIARLVVGGLALARGDIEVAEAHAQAALVIPAVADLRHGAHALRARVLLAQGRAQEALAEARVAVEVRGACRDLELTDGLAEVALAEALVAVGDHVAARETLEPAWQRLFDVGTTIASASRRERFFERPLANDRLVTLARELGIPLGLGGVSLEAEASEA